MLRCMYAHVNDNFCSLNLIHVAFMAGGGMKCVKNLTIHSASILSITASENWLGIGAADNSMSLYHKVQERPVGASFSGTPSKTSNWQLYRTPQKTPALVFAFFL